jgi:hypothetical protein
MCGSFSDLLVSIREGLAIGTMGVCKYCGKPAGLLASFHAACKAKADRKGKRLDTLMPEISLIIKRVASQEQDPATAKEAVKELLYSKNLSATEVKDAFLGAWADVLDDFLSDGSLDHAEQRTLESVSDVLEISNGDIAGSQYEKRLVVGAIVDQLINGQEVESPYSGASLPVVLGKGESVVWAYPGTQYYKDAMVRSFQGGSAGYSFRVAKGFYVRQSAFKGVPVSTQTTQKAGEGLLVLSTKAMYFVSSQGSTKVPYGKIISLEPRADGVEFCRDGARSLPEAFATGDGWSLYVFLMNLCRQ